MTDFLNTYELYHHGVIGQKWGVRRYQYQDGSLTPEGLKRYSRGDVHRIKREFKKEAYKENREQGMGVIKSYMNAGKEATKKTIEVVGEKRYSQVKAQDTAIGIGAALATAYLAASIGNNIEMHKLSNAGWNENWDNAWKSKFGPQYGQKLADKYRNTKASDIPTRFREFDDLSNLAKNRSKLKSKIYLNPFDSITTKAKNAKNSKK